MRKPFSPRARLALLLCLTLILAGTMLPAPPAAQAADSAHDYALTAGQFFPQAADRPGTGFEVRDDVPDDQGGALRFWSEFNRFGGVEALGYPISRVYEENGFHYQLFQRALLQWLPGSDTAALANVMDELGAEGADPWLSRLGIPSAIADDGSRGNFVAATRTRLSWLVEPHIRDFYLQAGNGDARQSMELFGLPTSQPVRSGPFVIQRFQRVALQVWLDRVPGMPAPGTVVPALVGDLYRQYAQSHGVFSDLRFVPQSASSGTLIAPPATASDVSDSLKLPLALLTENPEGQAVARALSGPGVRIVVQKVPAIAVFTASRMTIAVNPEFTNSDPKAVATVLAHEGSHLVDYVNGSDMTTSDGCYRTEITAFQTQARVWSAFYGPQGKANPDSHLDTELNEILDQVTHDPAGFTDTIKSAYRSECE